MTSQKRKFGDIGEDIACKWLEKRGFRIIERNYLKKWGELDIVAEKGKTLSFIEVKSVSWDSANGSHVTLRPEENMHPKKVERLRRALQTYLIDRRIPESREWQFHLVCVYMDDSARRAQVKLLENLVL